MRGKGEESTSIYVRYSSYSGEADGSVTPAESANGCFQECEDNADISCDGGDGGERGHKGLSLWLGAMFLVGEMAGAGVLSLPRAVANTGWVGLPMMIVLCLIVGYAGTRLALCWLLLEERWPEYRAPCRGPYPAIAYRALGKPGRVLAEVSLFLSLLGAATVYLILSAQTTHSLLANVVPALSQCAWIIIIGCILTPLTWIGTPKGFWPASVLAMSSTFLACLVVVIEVIVEKDDHDPPTFPAPTFGSFFLGFGAMLFALGGASIFPTIQNDMKDRAEFPQSVIITFLALMSLYLPVSTICYGILGSNGTPDNILQAVSGKAIKAVSVFLLVHFIFACTIVVNPVNQTLEGLLNFPHNMGVLRVLLRSGVMMLLMLTGLAVPDFGKILNLVGGSTVTIMCFILPPLCYLLLCGAKGHDGLPHRELGRWTKVLLILIIVMGVVGGVASTWSAFRDIISPGSFASTCFNSSTFLT